MKSFVVAITGASGSLYGIRLVEELLKSGNAVHLCISGQAFSIIQHETGIDFQGSTVKETEQEVLKHFASDTLRYFDDRNLAAPISSGSFKTDGMLVVPCSMKTLAGIAHGLAGSLITRAADVTMKEGRRLIIAPREMPFSAIHLENMLKLSRLGVIVAPPVPAFYQKPETLEDMTKFVVGKILDSAGVDHDLFQRWQ